MAGEPKCGYECPYTEAGHGNYRTGHDFVFPLSEMASAETSSAYLLGYEAARAAPCPEPLPREALDVERLARALQAWMGRGPAIQLPLAQAQELADLYAAALSPDRPTPP